MRRSAAVALVGIVLLLAGCPRPREAPTPAPPTKVPAPQLEGATIYTIDPAASHVAVLVYRGGAMARLGHNHVMTVKALTGRVWVHPRQLSRSGFQLAFPVNDVVVDDRDARLAAGNDFPPDIPDKDKAGTRTNMLRAEVLDGAKYPQVELASTRVEGHLPQPEITAAITLKGARREVRIPATVTVDANHVHAKGEFTIRQTEFGITPFSVALGAVQVQDELRVQFDLSAVTGP
ncbi:MAG: YceI family protein [Vicinamibacterales bacterium]